MSENDVVKVLQQMPGVAVGTDGMAGLYVRRQRGREPVMVDGTRCTTSTICWGSSTFNPRVKTMEFYKGSFPARHGRLSSVMDKSG